MNANVAVFDLDGTLVDSLAGFTRAVDRIYAKLSVEPAEPSELATMLGDGPRLFLQRALAARDQPLNEAVYEDFIADYTAHAAEGSPLFGGIEAVLDGLAGQGIRLAVCTNKPAAATAKLLASLGILERFDGIGAGDSFAFRKPDPRHLLETLRALDAAPSKAVMIGDHHNDYAAATGAGSKFIFAAWGYGQLDRRQDPVGIDAATPIELLTLVPHLLAE